MMDALPPSPPTFSAQSATQTIAMNMIDQLVSDAQRGLPLTKSSELSRGRLDEKDVPEAVKRVEANPDHSSYHLLFAIRRAAPTVYKSIPRVVRARVLVDALAKLQYVNDWGYLDPAGSQDGEAAVALLELGKDALAPLRSMLDDARPAPLYGSEPAAMSSTYHYRRKDFASRYVGLILGRPSDFKVDLTDRDSQIDQLKALLGSHR